MTKPENDIQNAGALFLRADENPFRSAEEKLSGEGFRVQTESNVYRAVATFATAPFDLAVVDLDALAPNQLECLSIFREINADVFIIAVFSPENRRKAADAARLGADACMAQPFYPNELETMLSRWAARTRRRLTSAAMQEANLESLARLARGTAHEINNPLTTISGWLQMMIDEEREQPAQMRLKSMLEESERIASVVRRLLAFGQDRLEAPAPVDINALLTELMDDMKNRRPGIKIEDRLHIGNALTMGDGRSLRQAFAMILADCAAALEDGGTLSVSSARARDGQIELKLSDNGRLIPAERLEDIFEPYHTIPRSGEEFSLAYPAIYGIIRSHGGEISVSSARAKGTVFTVILPGV